MKTLQKFNPESLERSRRMSAEQILAFLEDYRALMTAAHDAEPSRLISIKMPPPLLRAFQAKCEVNGKKYQTQIKALMKQWILE
jgi:uncharacterized protein (DUF4415 family)